MTLTKLNFITGNKNKLIEVRAILGNVIEVDNQAVDVPEIQGTIEDIAKEKARRAAEAVRLIELALIDQTRKAYFEYRSMARP
jgi:inosine triphosphate pyrophosphatase